MTSLHTLAITPVLRGLHNITAILKKAQDSDIDPAAIITSRIHPNMLPFATQISFFCIMASGIPSALNPALPSSPLDPLEDEPTLDTLISRIAKTISFLDSIAPEDLNGREDFVVKLDLSAGTVHVEFSAVEYVGLHIHPNFWFHVVTTYNLLRGLGLDIGKGDFLNGAKLHEWKVQKA